MHTHIYKHIYIYTHTSIYIYISSKPVQRHIVTQSWYCMDVDMPHVAWAVPRSHDTTSLLREPGGIPRWSNMMFEISHHHNKLSTYVRGPP